MNLAHIIDPHPAGHVAIFSRGRPTTYGALRDQVAHVRGGLARLGVQKGDRVALLSKNTAHWLISDFAIWMAGGVSVPLYPTLVASTIHQILTHSEAKFLFVGKLDGWEAMRPGIPEGVQCISHPLAPEDARQAYARWEDVMARTDPLPGQPVRPAEDLATIMYTSGTTGQPKGAVHTLANVWANAQAAIHAQRLGPEDRVLTMLPLMVT